MYDMCFGNKYAFLSGIIENEGSSRSIFYIFAVNTVTFNVFMARIILICYFLLTSLSIIRSQDTILKPARSSIFALGIGMGANLPAAGLKKRYGSNLNLSVQAEYITTSNFIFGPKMLFFFGDNVKEDVLAPFRTPTGVVLGDDNQIADVFLRQRGLFLGAGIGRLFSVNKTSKSGIKGMLHAGILQHNIRFTDERNSVAQIRAGRNKGYDRLTRGFALMESIGYKHLSNDRRLNFELMFDFIQGFTSEVRAYNFDTGLPTILSRLDLMFGFRAVWNLPFYKITSQETIFY